MKFCCKIYNFKVNLKNVIINIKPKYGKFSLSD